VSISVAPIFLRYQKPSLTLFKSIQMKSRHILPILTLSTLVLSGCGKDPDSFAFSGKAQKGPFVSGANVTVNELNSSFDQTGKSFTSSTSADDGSFSLNSVELETDYALVTANGFYFDEVKGGVSSSTLNLQALTDLSNKSTVNINVLTHVIRTRVEKYLAQGEDFQTANSLAKTELLSLFFNISGIEKDFDQLDITQANDDNAILLAFSVMMVGPWGDPAALIELLTNLRTDFGDNGTIDNENLMEQVMENASYVTASAVRKNMESKYQAMGIDINIPDFQKYLSKFVETHATSIYTDFQYPVETEVASHQWAGGEWTNILHLTTEEYSSSGNLVLAAISPLNQYVTIRISFSGAALHPVEEGYLRDTAEEFGWSLVDFQPNAYSLRTERQNLLCSMPAVSQVSLIPRDQNGMLMPITIEYFENGSASPAFTKTVVFNP
jgi:hypothetical protein